VKRVVKGELRTSYALLTLPMETPHGEEASDHATESVQLKIPSPGSAALHEVSWSIRTRSASCKNGGDAVVGSGSTPLAGDQDKGGLTHTQEAVSNYPAKLCSSVDGSAIPSGELLGGCSSGKNSNRGLKAAASVGPCRRLRPQPILRSAADETAAPCGAKGGGAK
jgi:hypothetical protein